MPFEHDIEFQYWASGLSLDAKAFAAIQRIRKSPPSRNVKGRRGNVRTRVANKKMGMTIQSESGTVEKPGIVTFYDHSDNVIEFYDQPGKIQLRYLSPSGRKVTAYHTADFFVIRQNEAGWEEWKSEEELEKLSQEQPNRYMKDSNGVWRCPPGEEYASQFGLYYRIRSSAEINWNLYSNYRFLSDYFDEDCPNVHPENQNFLYETVSQHQGITLTKLIETKVDSDDIYTLIARGYLYVNISKVRLSQSDQVSVFTNETAATAYQNMLSAARDYIEPATVDLSPGSQITWDGAAWTILNYGDNVVTIQHLGTKKLQEIPVNLFEELIKKRIIEGDPSKEQVIHSEVHHIWNTTTDAQKEVANYRLLVIQYYEANTPIDEIWKLEGVREVLGNSKSERTIREWVKNYRDAEINWGNGFVGLIPMTHLRGNYERKIPTESIEKVNKYIIEHHETLKQPFQFSSWVQYKKQCEIEGIAPVSVVTFGKEIAKRPLTEKVRKRKGRRAANQAEKRYFYLEPTTPKHGERAWQIIHIDHTKLDIQLRDAKTGRILGRPWATFAVDATTRRLLAVILSFDDPSYRTCMMVLREIVRRFAKLPQEIIVDNGADFQSTYFQSLLALYGVDVTYRPSGNPKFGDVVERLFLTSNTQFIYNLAGNTQIAKEVRLLTKSNDPQNLAVWNIGWLYIALREWAYQVYDQEIHSTLLQSPREAYQQSLFKHGQRAFKRINYQDFLELALPSPKHGKTRKVNKQGIKINNIYYWNELMFESDIAGATILVKYDPFNYGIAYAYLRKKWQPCLSEEYVWLKNRTELEIQIATEEMLTKYRLQGRAIQTVNAKLLADFLQNASASEKLLEQQLRDAETRTILEGINMDWAEETLKERIYNTSSVRSVTSIVDSNKLLPSGITQSTSKQTYRPLEMPEDL